MTFLKNRWILFSMLLASWALIASFFAGYYWLQYSDTMNRIGGVPIYSNFGVDYGNNTRSWSNSTKALTGMTFFKATRGVWNMTYETASGFGVYVSSINGVASNKTHGWVWWKWDQFMNSWARVDISADAYAVADNDTLLWYYESGWPPLPPP